MDLIDRAAVLEAISLGKTVTQLERDIMAIPGVAVVPFADLLEAEIRIRQLEEAAYQEDRSAIQGINPGLAELIKEKRVLKRIHPPQRLSLGKKNE
jgi:hypothetical protein